jgi:hypothetical protein
MLLDLTDSRLRATVRRIDEDTPNERARLVLDYPVDPPYPERVMQALSDLLRPAEEVTEGGRRE